MKKTIKLLFILAVLALPVNFALAEENPFAGEANSQPDINHLEFNSNQAVVGQDSTNNGQTALDNQEVNDVIVLNSVIFNITKEESWEGKKVKAFENKFVFQIDEETFKSEANLELKEMILAPGSKMGPPIDLQMASRIYQFDLKTTEDIKFEKDFWLSIKYDSTDYFRKNIYYFDEQKKQWVGLPGVIKDGAKKIVINFSLPYAKVAILEDIDIMTEGVASWYKYKSCDCAASPDYPKGTKLKVTNLDNNKEVIVKVNDWGPDRSIHPTRVIDLDIVAFKKIAKKSAGLCRVKVEPLNMVNVTTKK